MELLSNIYYYFECNLSEEITSSVYLICPSFSSLRSKGGVVRPIIFLNTNGVFQVEVISICLFKNLVFVTLF